MVRALGKQRLMTTVMATTGFGVEQFKVASLDLGFHIRVHVV